MHCLNILTYAVTLPGHLLGMLLVLILHLYDLSIMPSCLDMSKSSIESHPELLYRWRVVHFLIVAFLHVWASSLFANWPRSFRFFHLVLHRSCHHCFASLLNAPPQRWWANKYHTLDFYFHLLTSLPMDSSWLFVNYMMGYIHQIHLSHYTWLFHWVNSFWLLPSFTSSIW